MAKMKKAILDHNQFARAMPRSIFLGVKMFSKWVENLVLGTNLVSSSYFRLMGHLVFMNLTQEMDSP
jgi:hypothetical protein